jgi:hypothetical protein
MSCTSLSSQPWFKFYLKGKTPGNSSNVLDLSNPKAVKELFGIGRKIPLQRAGRFGKAPRDASRLLFPPVVRCNFN